MCFENARPSSEQKIVEQNYHLVSKNERPLRPARFPFFN